jgi:hypothetical protein
VFQLVNGHFVKVAAGFFLEKLSDSDVSQGRRPQRYHAIRVYSTEDTLPARMVQQFEFVAGSDYNPSLLHEAWQWLEEHATGPDLREHERLEDFIEIFAITLARPDDKDTFESMRRRRQKTIREAFDDVYDSYANVDDNDHPNFPPQN